MLHGRAARNRTESTCTPCTRTTTILQPVFFTFLATPEPTASIGRFPVGFYFPIKKNKTLLVRFVRQIRRDELIRYSPPSLLLYTKVHRIEDANVVSLFQNLPGVMEPGKQRTVYRLLVYHERE